MSGGSNQQYPPMGGGMGGGQGGPQPIGEYRSDDTWAPPGFITGGPYQGPPKYSHGAMYPDGSPVEGPGRGWGGGQGDPNRQAPAVMPPGWQSGGGMGGGWGQMPRWPSHRGGMRTHDLQPGDPGWQPGMGGGMPPIPPGWGQQPGGGGMQGGFGDWAGLGKGFSEDQFMKARSFADRGKMGRAKQAIEQGGGQWSDQLHGLLGSPNGRWGNMGWNTMY